MWACDSLIMSSHPHYPLPTEHPETFFLPPVNRQEDLLSPLLTPTDVLWVWQWVEYRELKGVQTGKRSGTIYHIVSSWWEACSWPRSSMFPVKYRHIGEYNEKKGEKKKVSLQWHMMLNTPILEPPSQKNLKLSIFPEIISVLHYLHM